MRPGCVHGGPTSFGPFGGSDPCPWLCVWRGLGLHSGGSSPSLLLPTSEKRTSCALMTVSVVPTKTVCSLLKTQKISPCFLSKKEQNPTAGGGEGGSGDAFQVSERPWQSRAGHFDEKPSLSRPAQKSAHCVLKKRRRGERRSSGSSMVLNPAFCMDVRCVGRLCWRGLGCLRDPSTRQTCGGCNNGLSRPWPWNQRKEFMLTSASGDHLCRRDGRGRT